MLPRASSWLCARTFGVVVGALLAGFANDLRALPGCPCLHDSDTSQQVEVTEIVEAVGEALDGCVSRTGDVSIVGRRVVARLLRPDELRSSVGYNAGLPLDLPFCDFEVVFEAEPSGTLNVSCDRRDIDPEEAASAVADALGGCVTPDWNTPAGGCLFKGGFDSLEGLLDAISLTEEGGRFTVAARVPERDDYPSLCAHDSDGDGQTSVAEIITALEESLSGCGPGYRENPIVPYEQLIGPGHIELNGTQAGDSALQLATPYPYSSMEWREESVINAFNGMIWSIPLRPPQIDPELGCPAAVGMFSAYSPLDRSPNVGTDVIVPIGDGLSIGGNVYFANPHGIIVGQ